MVTISTGLENWTVESMSSSGLMPASFFDRSRLNVG